jgi:hypothetical protein
VRRLIYFNNFCGLQYCNKTFPLTASLTHSLTHSLILIHSFTLLIRTLLSSKFVSDPSKQGFHLLTHALTHTHTHSLTHSLTHTLTHTNGLFSLFPYELRPGEVDRRHDRGTARRRAAGAGRLHHVTHHEAACGGAGVHGSVGDR